MLVVIFNPRVNNGGHGYSVGDYIVVTGAGHGNGTINVTAINSVSAGQWVEVSPAEDYDDAYLSKVNDDTAAGGSLLKA